MTPDKSALALPVEPTDGPAGRPIPRDPDALLYTSEAAFLTALSPRTLEALRVRGGGPKYFSLCRGRRAIRYRRSDVTEWIEAHRRKSTSDPGPTGEAAPDAAAPAKG